MITFVYDDKLISNAILCLAIRIFKCTL